MLFFVVYFPLDFPSSLRVLIVFPILSIFQAWEGFKDLATFEIQLKPMGFKRCPACQYPCEKADPLSCDHITCDLWMQKIAWSGAAMDLTQKMASSKSTHTYLRRAPQE